MSIKNISLLALLGSSIIASHAIAMDRSWESKGDSKDGGASSSVAPRPPGAGTRAEAGSLVSESERGASVPLLTREPEAGASARGAGAGSSQVVGNGLGLLPSSQPASARGAGVASLTNESEGGTGAGGAGAEAGSLIPAEDEMSDIELQIAKDIINEDFHYLLLILDKAGQTDIFLDAGKKQVGEIPDELDKVVRTSCKKAVRMSKKGTLFQAIGRHKAIVPSKPFDNEALTEDDEKFVKNLLDFICNVWLNATNRESEPEISVKISMFDLMDVQHTLGNLDSSINKELIPLCFGEETEDLQLLTGQDNRNVLSSRTLARLASSLNYTSVNMPLHTMFNLYKLDRLPPALARVVERHKGSLTSVALGVSGGAGTSGTGAASSASGSGRTGVTVDYGSYKPITPSSGEPVSDSGSSSKGSGESVALGSAGSSQSAGSASEGLGSVSGASGASGSPSAASGASGSASGAQASVALGASGEVAGAGVSGAGGTEPGTSGAKASRVRYQPIGYDWDF